MKFKALTIIPRNEAFEIKPLVLCRECKHFTEKNGVCYCKLYGWWHGGEWYCADGEKKLEGKTRLYYTQDGTVSWEEEDDDG